LEDPPTISTVPRQVSLDSTSDDGITEIRFSSNTLYRTHPVLGDYILMRVQGPLDEISARAKVHALTKTLRVRTDGKLTRRPKDR
jgi:hypothetical protein